MAIVGSCFQGFEEDFEFTSLQFVDPDVLQSGFGLNVLGWSSKFSENCQRISRQILPAFFSLEFFGLVSPRLQPHPKNSHPNLTVNIAGIALQCQIFHAHCLLTGAIMI